MKPEVTEQKFRRAHTEALGFLELARMSKEKGIASQPMVKAALAALQRVSNDDEIIDALCQPPFNQGL